MSRVPPLLSHPPTPYKPATPPPPAAAATTTTFKDAPGHLQRRLDECSRAGASCVTDIIAELGDANARYVLDVNSLDATVGPLRRELGDWQSMVRLSDWDACVERSFVKGIADLPPSAYKHLSYSLSGAYLHLRYQVLPSQLLVAPAMTLLSEYFRLRGLRVFRGEPYIFAVDDDDVKPPLVEGQQPIELDANDATVSFSPEDFFRMFDDVKADPIRAFDELFFGRPLFDMPSSSAAAPLFVVIRCTVRDARATVHVWIYNDKHAQENRAAMQVSPCDTLELAAEEERIVVSVGKKQQQQQQTPTPTPVMAPVEATEMMHAVVPATQPEISVVPSTPAAAMPPPSPVAGAASPSLLSPTQQPAASPIALFSTFAKRQRVEQK